MDYRFINAIYEQPTGFDVFDETEGDMPKTLVKKVLERFHRNYAYHTGFINLYGDGTGKNRSANGEPPYTTIERFLRMKGYTVVNHVQSTQNPHHITKHQTINDILSGSNPLCPKIKINMDTCSVLAMSIMSSPMKGDFQKDKSSELNKELPVEQQTHASDTFDYMVYGKYGILFSYGGSYSQPELRLSGR